MSQLPNIREDQVPRALLTELVVPQGQASVANPMIDPAEQREANAQVEYATCLICRDGIPEATGFLIGPDLVLTNHHAVLRHGELEFVPDRFSVKFEYGYNPDDAYRVARCIDWSPMAPHEINNAAMVSYRVPGAEDRLCLDYALLELKEPAGEQTIAIHSGKLKRPRGWIPMPTQASRYLTPSPVAARASVISVCQYPQDSINTEDVSLRFASGVIIGAIGVEQASNRREDWVRLRHSATTRDRSSGSPIVDSRGVLIGLHHAFVLGLYQAADEAANHNINQAIPIWAIYNQFDAAVRNRLGDAETRLQAISRAVISVSAPPVGSPEAANYRNVALGAIDRSTERATVAANVLSEPDDPVFCINHFFVRHRRDHFDGLKANLRRSLESVTNLGSIKPEIILALVDEHEDTPSWLPWKFEKANWPRQDQVDTTAQGQIEDAVRLVKDRAERVVLVFQDIVKPGMALPDLATQTRLFAHLSTAITKFKLDQQYCMRQFLVVHVLADENVIPGVPLNIQGIAYFDRSCILEDVEFSDVKDWSDAFSNTLRQWSRSTGKDLPVAVSGGFAELSQLMKTVFPDEFSPARPMSDIVEKLGPAVEKIAAATLSLMD